MSLSRLKIITPEELLEIVPASEQMFLLTADPAPMEQFRQDAIRKSINLQHKDPFPDAVPGMEDAISMLQVICKIKP